MLYLIALLVLDVDLQAQDKKSWRFDDIKVSFETEIDGGLTKVTAKDGGKIAVVSGKLSHTDLKRASASEKEVTLSCKILAGGGVLTVHPVAFGLVRMKETSWLPLGPLASGVVGFSDEKNVERITVGRKKGEPAVLTLTENQSRVAFAFPIPKDGKAPFEFRIGDLKKAVTP